MRLVNDIQGNRDAIALMELNTAGMREKLIALKARKNLDMHTDPMVNQELSKEISKYFPSASALHDDDEEEGKKLYHKLFGEGCQNNCHGKDIEELRKTVETMKREQKIMVNAVEESIKRSQTIADLAIQGYKNSEKKLRIKWAIFVKCCCPSLSN